MKQNRIFIILLLTVMLLLAFSVAATASDPPVDPPAAPTLRLESGDGNVNDIVTVKVWVKDNPGLLALGFGLVYDSDYLQPQGYVTNIIDPAECGDDWVEGVTPDPFPSALVAANPHNVYTDPDTAATSAMYSYTLISYTLDEQGDPIGLADPAEGDDLFVTFSFKIIAAPEGGVIPLQLVKFATNAWMRDADMNVIVPQLDCADAINIVTTPVVDVAFTAAALTEEGDLLVALTNYGDAISGLTVMAALYDGDNCLLEVAMKSGLAVGVGEDNELVVPDFSFAGFSANAAAAARCKVFLMGAEYAPLCAAVAPPLPTQ